MNNWFTARWRVVHNGPEPHTSSLCAADYIGLDDKAALEKFRERIDEDYTAEVMWVSDDERAFAVRHYLATVTDQRDHAHRMAAPRRF